MLHILWRQPLRVFQTRAASTKPKPTSPHVGFYKSFGRPVAKVFLGAVFTYQVVYWFWVKHETDEIKEQKQNKIIALKARVRSHFSKH